MLASLFAAAVLAQDPAPAQPAPTFSYTFVQVGVFTTELDAFDENSNGFGFDASYGFHPNAYVFVGASFESADINGVDVDGRGFGGGVGVHTDVHEKVDLFGEVSFLSVRAEALGLSDSETGFGLAFGARTMPVDRLEIDAAVIHTDVYESDTNFGVGARFYATEAVSIGASAILDSDGNSYGLNVRYGF